MTDSSGRGETDSMGEGEGFRAQPGKYLTFRLGTESYGVDALRVQEIIRMSEITRVPNTPEFVRGVINLRGRITPVVELSGKLGLEWNEPTERTCIVVVQTPDMDDDVGIGLIVDEVSDVHDLKAEQIERAPWLGGESVERTVIGMAKVEELVLILLDVESIISTDEVIALGALSKDAELVG